MMKRFCVNVDASNMLELHIPRKFAKGIEESVSKNIKLEGPSGITRHVRTAKSDDTLVLKSGWKDFVTANEIDKNDSLVFTYKGNSSFQVLIFDLRGCEKDAPFLAEKTETESNQSNDSSVQVGGVPHCEVNKKIMSISSGSDTASASADTTEETSSGKRKQRDFVQESSESDEENRPIRKTKEKRSPKKKHRSYMVPQQTNLTKTQVEIFDRMAQNAQKGSELLAKVLTKTNTYAHRNSVLNLPKGFACNVLRMAKQTVTLLPANLDKSRRCIANYYINGNTRCISWHKFVRKNRLKEGDLCLFELRKQDVRGHKGLTMLVQFETKSGKSIAGPVRVGSETTPAVRAVKRKREESRCSDKETHRKRNKNDAKRTSRPYTIPYKTHLTEAQEQIANQIAQKARKGSELFVKILSASSTHLRSFHLILPSRFASDVLRDKKRKITLVPANSAKRTRECRAKYRKNTNNRRVIGSGWSEFVRRNGLKEGDFCVFELRKERKEGKLVLTMVVHHFDH